MDFTVSKAAFLKGLYLAQGIADKKGALPILANVLVKSESKNRLLIAATDLTVSLACEVEAKVSKEGGLTVGARALYDVIKGLPTDEIVVSRKDNNWVHIKSGKSEFKIVGQADRDFPKLPDHREVTFAQVETGLLSDLIDKTLFSVSTDETRYHLSGALFEADGTVLRLVSTDGHRLSIAEGSSPFRLEGSALIPRKGVAELRKALETADSTIEVAFHQGQAYFKLVASVLSIKLIDAKFPPYDQVIPKTAEKLIELKKSVLVDALRRVSLLSVEKTNGIRVELKKGALVISADNPDLGEAREEIDVDYTGGALSIGFNARYLLEVLAQVPTDQVILELNGELDPGVLHPSDGRHYLGVVMPMRI